MHKKFQQIWRKNIFLLWFWWKKISIRFFKNFFLISYFPKKFCHSFAFVRRWFLKGFLNPDVFCPDGFCPRIIAKCEKEKKCIRFITHYIYYNNKLKIYVSFNICIINYTRLYVLKQCNEEHCLISNQYDCFRKEPLTWGIHAHSQYHDPVISYDYEAVLDHEWLETSSLVTYESDYKFEETCVISPNMVNILFSIRNFF